MTVVVTGASGHIGNNLVRALLERGVSVRAVVHRNDRALEGLDVERIEADVLDRDSLVRAFRGCDVVYHLAGYISIVPYEADRLHRINVIGTRNAVFAAIENRVRRFLYTSSIESLLHPGKGDPVDEAGPPLPEAPVTFYGRTKALAEAEVHQGIDRGLDAVIVHPTAVVGPYDFQPSFFGQAFIDFAHRKLPAFTQGSFDLVDVRDLVAGMLAAAEKGSCGEHYLLGGDIVAMSDLSATLERCTGVPSPRFKVPLWLAGFAGLFMPTYYRLSGRRPRFTRMSLKMLDDGRNVSHAKAERELGYSPRPPSEGVEAQVKWFQDNDMIHPVFLSRRAPAIVLAVALVLIICLGGGGLLLATGSSANALLGLAAIVFGVVYLWLTCPVRYEIERDRLVVRGGPFRWKIPFEAIRSVQPSRNPISAPAWSWKRLRINFEKKGRESFVLISPRDRGEFLQKLAGRAPGTKTDGERLTRKPGMGLASGPGAADQGIEQGADHVRRR